MKQQIVGPLRFDLSSGRYWIGEWELHCGDCFQVLLDDDWRDTRIETTGGIWYLVDVSRWLSNYGSIAGIEARSYPL